MRNSYKLILVGLLVVPFLAAATARGADTPAEAVMNLRDSLVDNDQDAFVACFDVDEPQQKVLGAFFGFAQSLKNFDEKVVAAFGEEAASVFREDGPPNPFGELADLTEDDLIIEEDGDTATVRKVDDDDDDDPLQLVRTDGDWLIVFDDAPTSEEEAEAATKMLAAMATVMDDAAEAAGQPDMTPEALQEKIGVDMISVMMEMAAEMEEANAEGDDDDDDDFDDDDDDVDDEDDD